MRPVTRIALVALALASVCFDAAAAIDNANILNNVLTRYSDVASGWGATITGHATRLFWTLAVISMVWTFGMMALRKADIGEFFAEFIRFIVFTGFFLWLLRNGPRFAISIMDSMRAIGGDAAGVGPSPSPSGIADIGFDIFFKVLDQSTVWSPVDSIVGIAISAVVLVCMALIGVNMLILSISGWILAYAGIFFLGFGGSRWTSDMAINYFKTVLSLAAQLLAMVLLVGIGKSFIDAYYVNMSEGVNLKELGVMLIVSVTLLALVNKVPGMIGGLAMGGGTHSLGNGAGAGAALGGMAVGAAAAATAGAALTATAANVAGGGQALMAAFSKANAAANGGGESAGGGGSSGSSSTGFASAMGDSGGDFGPSGSAGGGSSGSSSSSGGGSSFDSVGGMAAHAGRVAAGTVSNLAQGFSDVAKAKAASLKEAAVERVSTTFGGQIAGAINDRAKDQQPDPEENSLSGSASDTKPDPAAEVAAFENKPPQG